MKFSLAKRFNLLEKGSKLIHQTIINNVYQNPIVVCDVSHKNTNVMFELGMRLAFNKPVVIVKDDETDYSFDTGIIEHLNYPRDLRHGAIEKFKTDLLSKVEMTYQDYLKPNSKKFLDNFGTFEVSGLNKSEVDLAGYVEKGFERIEGKFNQLYSRLENKFRVEPMDRHPNIRLNEKHILRIGKKFYIKFVNFMEGFYPNIAYSFKGDDADPGDVFIMNCSDRGFKRVQESWLNFSGMNVNPIAD